MADGLTGGRSDDKEVSNAVADDALSGYQASMAECKLATELYVERVGLEIVRIGYVQWRDMLAV